MYIVFGHRLYGAVDRSADTHIATRFFHVYWMPLVPLGSHLVLAQNGDGAFRGKPVGLNLRSVLAAYARTWGLVAAAGAWVGLITTLSDGGDAADVLAVLLTALVLSALVVLAFARLGRLPADARAQRFVYSHFTGSHADVADIAHDLPALRDVLHARLASRAPALADLNNYRAAPDPARDWRAVALAPGATDAEYLGAALTLARLEWATAADPRGREEHAALHARIWDKIRTHHAALLAPATS